MCGFRAFFMSEDEYLKQRLKTLLCCLLISQLFLITVYAKPDWPSDTDIQAESGIVIDADSGAVIFGKNMHGQYPPASITKILTALIVLERAKPDDMVTFSKDSVLNVEAGSGNKLNVTDGDKLSVEDCLYSLILHSCNQAANALAEHVAGSREDFVKLMNQKLEELGCTESHFENPSGLNGDTQYVSAYDMGLIAKAAYSNKKLVEISSALSHKIPPTTNNPEGLTIYNEHRLVKTKESSSEFYFPSAVAGKTGYLIKAGNTLVTYAEQDGRRLISVILKGSPRQYFVDGKNLLQFGYDRFQNIKIDGNETSYIQGEEPVVLGEKSFQPSELELEQGQVITLPKDAKFSDASKTLVADLPKGSPKGAVGLIQYTYNDRNVGRAYLMAKNGVPESDQTTGESTKEAVTTDGSKELPASGVKMSGGKGVGIIAVVLAGILLVAGAGIGFVVYKRKKEFRESEIRREERRRRLREEGDGEAFERMLKDRRNTKGKK
jgi:D-alanyl-D-alanine carboxypeptidase